MSRIVACEPIILSPFRPLFEASFLRQQDSSENWLELKTEPPFSLPKSVKHTVALRDKKPFKMTLAGFQFDLPKIVIFIRLF